MILPRYVLVTALLVTGCSALPAAAETLPGQFSGTTEGQTASFALRGGDYIVDWSATEADQNGAGCYFAPALKQDSGSGFETLPDVDVPTGSTKQGSANLHDVGAGNWYFDVITHCHWTLRIHR